MSIKIDIDEMENAIHQLNSSLDDINSCAAIISSYQTSIEEMESKALNNSDDLEIMVKETIQLLEAVESASNAVENIKDEMESMDNKEKKIGD